MNEPSLAAKASTGREGQLQFAARPLAQVGVNLEAAVGDDLARVEEVVRVERGFDLAHHAQQAVAELLGHELGPRDADAVFAPPASL